MSDKFGALKAAALAATPGPWYRSSVTFNGITSEQTFITQGNKPHIANAGEKRDAIFIAAVSPDVVLSLLAALEEKDQELDKEGDILIDTQESMREWKLRANAAEQREEHLKASVDVLSAKNAELEQRLQQPIKLPNTTTNRHEWTTWQWIEHVGGRYQHGDPGDYIEFGSVMAVGAMLQQFQRTVIAVALVEIKNSLRLQGFKVEGE